MSKLNIYTLGNFEIRNDSVNITEKAKTDSKCWKLFQYLITYRDREVSREDLIMEMGLNENDDPESSLSALMYRLRSKLNDKLKIPPAQKIISTRGCSYTFNQSIDYWLDAEMLEETCQKIRGLLEEGHNSFDEIMELFDKALDLYRGNYLEDAPSHRWVWTARQYYRQLLTSTLQEITEQMQEEKQYSRLWSYYEKIGHQIKFDEDLLIEAIELLLKAGKTGLAFQKYREAEKLFEDNDLIKPPKLVELKTRLPQKNHADPRSYLQEIHSDGEDEGPYICDADTFTRFYELEIRRTRRDLPPRQLVQIDLETSSGKCSGKELADNFFSLLSNQLRNSDIVCRWHECSFVILLVDVTPEDAEKVIERIENSFKAIYDVPDYIELQSEMLELGKTGQKLQF